MFMVGQIQLYGGSSDKFAVDYLLEEISQYFGRYSQQQITLFQGSLLSSTPLLVQAVILLDISLVSH